MSNLLSGASFQFSTNSSFICVAIKSDKKYLYRLLITNLRKKNWNTYRPTMFNTALQCSIYARFFLKKGLTEAIFASSEKLMMD